MNLAAVHLATFSPTGTTRTILAGIAAGIGAAEVRRHDLTLDRGGSAAIHTAPDDLVLFGVPVYSGRVVRAAIPRLRRIRGTGTLAVPVVLYGNREFEDAFLELTDLVRAQGFTPLAAAAFIGEHSFSTPDRPIAAGRPDPQDLEAARPRRGSGTRRASRLATLSWVTLLTRAQPFRRTGESGETLRQ